MQSLVGHPSKSHMRLGKPNEFATTGIDGGAIVVTGGLVMGRVAELAKERLRLTRASDGRRHCERTGL